MQVVNLYRYKDRQGNVVTPIRRNDTDTPHAYRLIADEGMTLVKNGEIIGNCIDTATVDGFEEIKYVEDMSLRP